MRTYWKEFKQQGVRREGAVIPMATHYLFNENGLYLGWVQKLSWGEWRAYAGRPGVHIGDFPSVEEAKKAVEKTLA